MSQNPEYTTPYLSENYTGPYLSDGRIQESVEFGTMDPKSVLDELSRLHDSAYAKWKDSGHRYAADKIYNEEAQKLVSMFPHLAGNLVLYGNAAGNAASNIASSAVYGPLGLLYGAVKNMLELNDKMVNGSKYRKDILGYYKADPGWSNSVKLNDRLPDTVYDPTFDTPKIRKPLTAPAVKIAGVMHSIENLPCNRELDKVLNYYSNRVKRARRGKRRARVYCTD
jgi:hypothetical protein